MRLPPRTDVVLALVLMGTAQAEMWWYDGGPSGTVGVTTAAALVHTALLAFRSVTPVFAASSMAVVLVVQAALGGRLTSTLSVALASMLLCFSVGLLLHRSVALATAGSFLVATWVDIVLLSHDDFGVLSDVVFTTVMVVGAPFLAGRALRDRRKRTDELERVNAELSAQRDEVARLAAIAERGRIAREVHDVLAHSVSLMVVQAGAARHLLDKDSAQSRQALEAAEAVGREALSELRATLDVLRTDEVSEEGSLTPQPDLRQLDSLAATMRSAGVPVSLMVDDLPQVAGMLSRGSSIAAYRIVQECLTNVLKHAGGAAATVTVAAEADGVRIEVVDDGPGGRATTSTTGHGLQGMAERARIQGGTLTTASDADGFLVRAWLPAGGAR